MRLLCLLLALASASHALAELRLLPREFSV